MKQEKITSPSLRRSHHATLSCVSETEVHKGGPHAGPAHVQPPHDGAVRTTPRGHDMSSCARNGGHADVAP